MKKQMTLHETGKQRKKMEQAPMSLTSRSPTGSRCRSVGFIRDTQAIAKRKAKHSESPLTMSATVHFFDPAGMEALGKNRLPGLGDGPLVKCLLLRHEDLSLPFRRS